MRESYACYVRAYTPQPESKLRGAARNNYVTAVTDEKHNARPSRPALEVDKGSSSSHLRPRRREPRATRHQPRMTLHARRRLRRVRAQRSMSVLSAWLAAPVHAAVTVARDGCYHHAEQMVHGPASEVEYGVTRSQSSTPCIARRRAWRSRWPRSSGRPFMKTPASALSVASSRQSPTCCGRPVTRSWCRWPMWRDAVK